MNVTPSLLYTSLDKSVYAQTSHSYGLIKGVVIKRWVDVIDLTYVIIIRHSITTPLISPSSHKFRIDTDLLRELYKDRDYNSSLYYNSLNKSVFTQISHWHGPIKGVVIACWISNKVNINTRPVGTRKGDFFWGLYNPAKEGHGIFWGVRRLRKKC